MNPFTAPQHDSPPPGDGAPPPQRARPHELVRLLGVLEVLAGAGFALISTLVLLPYLFLAEDTPHSFGLLLAALGVAVVMGVCTIFAGQSLRRGPSRKEWLLQIGPALILLLFLFGDRVL